MLRKFKLNTDCIIEVATLIFESDISIFTLLFKNKANALSILCNLIKGEHNCFSYKHILVYLEKNKIIGIVLSFNPTAINSKKEWTDIKLYTKIHDRIRLIFANIILDNICKLEDVSDIYIQNVCIKKEYRGKGIGNKMMKALLQYARNKEINSLYLDASIMKPKVRLFYESLGFIIVRRIQLPLSFEGVDRMKLKLDDL